MGRPLTEASSPSGTWYPMPASAIEISCRICGDSLPKVHRAKYCAGTYCDRVRSTSTNCWVTDA